MRHRLQMTEQDALLGVNLSDCEPARKRQYSVDEIKRVAPLGTVSLLSHFPRPQHEFSSICAIEFLPEVSSAMALSWSVYVLGLSVPCTATGATADGEAAILYSAGELFACRRCYGLAYESQQSNSRRRCIAVWAKRGRSG